MWRLRPALPMRTLEWSVLPTWPTVARAVIGTLRTSPEGRRTCANAPSLAMTCAATPAERTIWPPLPGLISTLWISVPRGMLAIGRQLPGLMSAVGPLITVSPTFRPRGARM